MKRTTKYIISFLILASAISVAQAKTKHDQVVDKIIETGNADNRTMEYIDVLSNKIGGRLIGSNAYDNAIEWCASKFEEWGLEVWVQEVGEVPVGFNRGPWFGRMLGGNGMALHFATPSYTVGTKGRIRRSRSPARTSSSARMALQRRSRRTPPAVWRG